MFKDTISLFKDYEKFHNRRNTPGFNRDLSAEVIRRLQQLEYIVNRVKELENISGMILSRHQAECIAYIKALERRNVHFESVPAPPTTKISREEIETHQKISFEIELLTETFYYLAGRTRTVLRNKQFPFPGINTFDCEGVRNVRNKLLEHAEGKDSQVVIQSIAWGREQGPVLKAVRPSAQKHVFPDKGLYVNEEEFCINLEYLLQNALTNT